MKILVTGSRDFDSYETVMRGIMIAFEKGIDVDPDDNYIEIIQGGCKTGGDELARTFANTISNSMADRGYTVKSTTINADWDKYGRAAGPIRNQKMVNIVSASSEFKICVAFFSNKCTSKGTLDCSTKAKAAGITVDEYVVAPKKNKPIHRAGILKTVDKDGVENGVAR